MLDCKRQSSKWIIIESFGVTAYNQVFKITY